MTYTLCKRVIEITDYKTVEQKDNMQLKLDIFLLNNRIDGTKYNELTTMLADKVIA